MLDVDASDFKKVLPRPQNLCRSVLFCEEPAVFLLAYLASSMSLFMLIVSHPNLDDVAAVYDIS